TCSSSGVRADISRAAAPGGAVGIKAIAWRAAGTAFLTKPALQRKFAWQPKRHRTLTASPERRTTIRLVRSASINPKNQKTRAHTRETKAMNAGLVAQYVMNGVMLGMMYALVAVGFTLFFGVLDVIKFSHGDVLMLGAFTALATYGGVRALGIGPSSLELAVIVAAATVAMALVGMAIARYLVMPLRALPAPNTLLIPLMAGPVLRGGVRLFYPQGANPKPFPALLPKAAIDLGGFNLRLDNVIMLAAGALAILGLQFLLNRTKLGLAIRAVAQD